MKRLPLAISFVLFILLCASIAYWGLQMFKPPLRPVAAPPRTAAPEIRPDAATALFGGRTAPAAVASNYQLRGVIFSGRARDSVAIISADGKPPQAIRVDSEVVPGVTVKEVHPGYVILAENGTTKRVELPETGRDAGITSTAPPRPGNQPTLPTSPTPPGRSMGTRPAPTPPNQSPVAPAAQPAPQQPAFAAPQPAAAPPATPTTPVTPQAPATNAPPTMVVTPPTQAGTTRAAPPSPPPGALTPTPQPVVPGSIGSSGTSTVPGSPPLQSR